MLNKYSKKYSIPLSFAKFLSALMFHEKKITEKIELSEINNVIVIDYALIGDTIMSIPMLRVIRSNLPKARITILCNATEKKIVEQQDIVDNFLVVSFDKLFDFKHPVKVKKYIYEIYSNCKDVYDLAIEPRGDLRLIYLMHCMNAKRKISYDYTGGRGMLTDVVTPSEKVKHLVDDKLYILEQIGFRVDEKLRNPFLRKEIFFEENRKRFVQNVNALGKTIIGIHPGASLYIKQWEQYDILAEEIHRVSQNCFFVIFCGPGEDDIANKVANYLKERKIEYLLSKTSMDEYIKTISYCDIVICNDSGAGHLASALGVEVFVLMGPFDPEFGAPMGEKVHTFSKKISCKPCLSRTCSNDKQCLKLISVHEVVSQVVEVLKTKER